MKPNRKRLRIVADWCEYEEQRPYGGQWLATLAGAETADTNPEHYADPAKERALIARYYTYGHLYSIPAWVAAAFVNWGYKDQWTVNGVSIYEAARQALGVDGNIWAGLINADNTAADVRWICEQAT